MLVVWETEPPDSSALTSSRCWGALSGILPVAGSAPRRCARPSAVSTAVRCDVLGAAGAAVEDAPDPPDPPDPPPEPEVGAVDLAGVVVPASTLRNSSMF